MSRTEVHRQVYDTYERLPSHFPYDPGQDSGDSKTGDSNKSGVEEIENNKDVTDSGYSNSCSNSQSQRSGSGSSKCSGHAGSSGSGSSSFLSPLEGLQKVGKDGKDRKDRKDKKMDQDKKSKRKKKNNADRNATVICGPPLVDEDSKLTISAPSADSMPSQATMPQLMDTGVDTEVLQAAALSQTLHTMMKMKYQDTQKDDLEERAKDDTSINSEPLQTGENPEITLEQIASLKTDTLNKGELRIAVSILDGVVIYTSNLTQALGYPKDMWIGRSLVDFVHTKHRASFASFIIQSIAELIPGGIMLNSHPNVYFCCLRKYRGLNKGFQLSDQRVSYLPCQITLQFKELPPVGETFYKECLIITAVPVRSAYHYPCETRMSPKFMTRHSVNCQLVHVDPEVTPYFGFLPQDMLGRSVLDFYHPEDLHFLKEVYEAVIKEPGHPFRSKPYRFLCQNGGYVLIDTELSSFINPWTRKLEFIIGQHSVLRGPDNPDVTTPCDDLTPRNISDEVLKESKVVQEEIKNLLNETVVRSTETAKQQVSKRCKDLAAFMENLMDEITKQPDLKIVVPTEEQSFSERDSVMLGEISPHHDYFDRQSMSETPPSYNQLNYNDNIHRFFESKPKTTVSDMSSGSGGDQSGSGEEGKNTPTNKSSGSGSSGDSGGSSGQSTGSNGNSPETTSNDVSNNSNPEGFKSPALTEQLLSRHNEDMEKQMVQKHRVSRTKGERDSKVKERMKTAVKGQETKNHNGDESSGVISHGVKRSGSMSWEGEPNKTIKASHSPALQLANAHHQPTLTEPSLLAAATKFSVAGPSTPSYTVVQPGPQIVPMTSASNVWSPFPVGSPAQINGSPNTDGFTSQEFPGAAVNGALMPMYYHMQNHRSTEATTLPPSHNSQISHHQPAGKPTSYHMQNQRNTEATTLPPTHSSLISHHQLASKPMYYHMQNQQSTEETTHPPHNSLINHHQPAVQLMQSMLYHPFMYGTPPIQMYSSVVYPPAGFSLNNNSNNLTPTSPQLTVNIKSEPILNIESRSTPSCDPHTPSNLVPQSLSIQKSSSENEGGSNEIGTIPGDDSSYQSSFYSFLKTDKSDESMRSSSDEKQEEHEWGTKQAANYRPVRKVAPWIENVNVTSDLMMKYRLKERRLADTLQDDALALANIRQPSIVNDQLTQMYQDLEIEGLAKTLTLEEGVTSSSDSSGDDVKTSSCKRSGVLSKRRKRYMEYDKMTILFEEDAPMPPPVAVNYT